MSVLVGYKRFFTIMNVILLSGCIFLYHIGFLSEISFGIFLVICLIVFGFALYRPVMTFALFVGMLPLEIINVAPEVIGMSLRPYQLLGVAALFGMVSAFVFRKDVRNFFVWNIFDTIILMFFGVSSISAFVNVATNDVVWAQTIIFGSFCALYFVTRFFVREKKEVIALFPIFISSGVVVGFYAIMQNVLFSAEMFHREIMPGRPNATFTEPDWLGVYLVFIFSVCLAYLYYNAYHKHLWKFFDVALYIATFVIVLATIITVARSAWLGSCAVALVYFLFLIIQKKYKLFARHFLWNVTLVFGSILVVTFLPLTSFELDNRVKSTGTGKQEITVVCKTVESRDTLTRMGHVTHTGELSQYDCRHINLEEVEDEVLSGNYIIKIHRDDPNISVRSDVYKETLIAVKEKPFFGYGWGSSARILGNDAAGTPLNASNIIFETAIATGLIGAVLLSALFLVIVFFAARIIWLRKNMMSGSVALFALLGAVAILVSNLFNAGLLLGFVWVYFGIVALLPKIVQSMK